MKVFFDTEFTGLHQNTTLISIGCVSESGREFYAELTDYDESQIDGWLKLNVIGNLIYGGETKENRWFTEGAHVGIKGDSIFVADVLSGWLGGHFGDGKVVMISDCLAYDWVLFCQLFGGALHVPPFVHYVPLDLSTLLWSSGVDPDVNREEFAGQIKSDSTKKHNALWDAKVIKRCFNKAVKCR